MTDIADETEKFLRYLAEEVGVSAKRNEWLARNFRDGSCIFDIAREAMRNNFVQHTLYEVIRTA